MLLLGRGSSLLSRRRRALAHATSAVQDGAEGGGLTFPSRGTETSHSCFSASEQPKNLNCRRLGGQLWMTKDEACSVGDAVLQGERGAARASLTDDEALPGPLVTGAVSHFQG